MMHEPWNTRPAGPPTRLRREIADWIAVRRDLILALVFLAVCFLLLAVFVGEAGNGRFSAPSPHGGIPSPSQGAVAAPDSPASHSQVESGAAHSQEAR